MYIGQSPSIGNFQVCDAISVVNGQAAYTMQVSSVNVVPETANHMIVSLNGVIQAPGSSYTVSGSTITFASNLVTGDVIDFIHILGSVLDLGVPSDATVTDAKTNFVSTSSAAGLQIKGDGTTDGTLQLNCSQNSHGIKLKSPAHSAGASYTLTFPVNDGDANQFLQTNGSGVLSFAAAGGGMYEFISTTDVTSGVAQVDFTSFSTDYSDFHLVIQNIVTTTDAQELKLRFFNNAGSIVDGSSYQWSFHGADTGSIQNDSNGSNTDHAQLGRAIGNASRESANYEITMYDVHFTDDWRQFKFSQVYPNAAGEFGFQNGGGFSKYNNSDNFSISGVRIFWNSGNIASGRFSLYGRKHS
jgi:hypothetical protein